MRALNARQGKEVYVSQISAFQEGLVKPISRGNRRATIRYRCAPATVGKVFSTDDQEFQRAWILDLSVKGIGMQLSRPLELGQLVIITIRSGFEAKVHELSARVIHCTAVPQWDWLIGCELVDRLTPELLDQLL
jgi:PilZ domain